MNAMTWWDHGTNSIWSQPWGSAIAGPLEGTALTLIPASIVPWSTWRENHPGTTVVSDDLGVSYRGIRDVDGFVIGVALEEWATAYQYRTASEVRVINDAIGPRPVAVFVEPSTRDISVWLRSPGQPASGERAPDVLTFDMDDDGLVRDAETGTRWDTSRGLAVEGPLRGASLQQIPWITSFDWAWENFFPHTEFYGEGKGGARCGEYRYHRGLRTEGWAHPL